MTLCLQTFHWYCTYWHHAWWTILLLKNMPWIWRRLFLGSLGKFLRRYWWMRPNVLKVLPKVFFHLETYYSHGYFKGFAYWMWKAWVSINTVLNTEEWEEWVRLKSEAHKHSTWIPDNPLPVSALCPSIMFQPLHFRIHLGRDYYFLFFVFVWSFWV